MCMTILLDIILYLSVFQFKQHFWSGVYSSPHVGKQNPIMLGPLVELSLTLI